MSNEWMQDAACRVCDPEIFFPFTNMSVESARALLVCRTCPVRLDCYGYAIRNGETFGIWGGVQFNSRNNIVRGSDEEEELRDAVYKSLDAGWSISKTAVNLHIPFNMTRRFARERYRENGLDDATVDQQFDGEIEQPNRSIK